ncbi:MAG: M2 family metallopeptidase [Pseudomonadota bacterium]
MKPLFFALLFITAVGCGASNTGAPTTLGPTNGTDVSTPRAPTVQEARAFINGVENELLRLLVNLERVAWVKYTYITHDTAILLAQAEEATMEYVAKKAKEAMRFDKLKLPFEIQRKFDLLKLSLSLPAPLDAKKRSELAKISGEMPDLYAKGKYCSPSLPIPRKKGLGTEQNNCLPLEDLSELMAKSRDYDVLLEIWKGWRTISPSMRALFSRYVELANQGAQDLGFSNLGDLWKSRFDMSPDAFEKEVDRLWEQVNPLYQDLHCYARAKLQNKYGKKRVPENEPIPAHLLGNMWSQEWGNIKELLLPGKGNGINLEKELKKRKTDEQKMVRYGEAFFVSLGLDPLPKTFWEHSLFVKPKDRDVVCHASAWDIDFEDDVRIKMCIRINDEDFATIHHELGHNYYQYYYRHQPGFFRDSANKGFHEGLGDTISLSVTPPYLMKIGLIHRLPKDDLGPLMERALDKIAFLPFGLIIDKWRWDVFAGKIKPNEYNQRWWELRTRYQGIKPPVERTEEDFDPGAKYHIAANVPYIRYFLAAILQFQFHRALCQVVGHKGPLHTCSIYGNKEAGNRLAKMMEMGQSRPWPEALKVMTGQEEMDASAILEYFKPLHDWLKEQNKGHACGW